MKWRLTHPAEKMNIDAVNFKVAAWCAFVVGSGTMGLVPIDARTKKIIPKKDPQYRKRGIMPILMGTDAETIEEWLKVMFGEDDARMTNFGRKNMVAVLAGLRSVKLADKDATPVTPTIAKAYATADSFERMWQKQDEAREKAGKAPK